MAHLLAPKAAPAPKDTTRATRGALHQPLCPSTFATTSALPPPATTPAPATVSKMKATAAQASRSSLLREGALEWPGVMAGASMGAVPPAEPAEEGRRGEEAEEGSLPALARLISALSVDARARASRSSIAARTSSSSCDDVIYRRARKEEGECLEGFGEGNEATDFPCPLTKKVEK